LPVTRRCHDRHDRTGNLPLEPFDQPSPPDRPRPRRGNAQLGDQNVEHRPRLIAHLAGSLPHARVNHSPPYPVVRPRAAVSSFIENADRVKHQLRPAKAPRLPAALPGAVNATAAARYPGARNNGTARHTGCVTNETPEPSALPTVAAGRGRQG